MAHLRFPDAGSRLVITDAGRPVTNATGTVYTDAAATTPATIYTDTNGVRGAAITNSQVTTDSHGQLPHWWGPSDDTDRLYISVNSGPVWPVDADYNSRIDALTARVVDVEESGGGGGGSDPDAVKLTGNQTIAGVKTFASSPVVPTTPSGAGAAAAKSYVDTTVATSATATLTAASDLVAAHATIEATARTTDDAANLGVAEAYTDTSVAAALIAAADDAQDRAEAVQIAAAADATSKANTAQATAIASSLQKTANLSDLTNSTTARTNLGLGTAALLSVGTTANTVAAGNDARLTDTRTPTAHAASHAAAGSDAVTVAQSQVTGLSATLAAKADLVDGMVPSSQIPPLVFNAIYTVESQAEMLALPADGGDLAVRADLDPVEFYILTGEDPSVLANWTEVNLAGSVITVNGQSGSVVLGAADVGAVPTGRTITAGTALTGGGDLTANRTISANVGTTSGTLAAGDDTRITGAAQKSANLSDLANTATARTNLGLGNVANTAPADLPISTATQAALDTKPPIGFTVYNLAVYGGVNGGGAGSSQTAWNTMLTAWAAAGSSGEIYIPPGTWDIGAGQGTVGSFTAAVVLNNQKCFRIRGSGRQKSFIKCSGQFLYAGTNSDEGYIADLHLICTTASNTSDGIVIDYPRRWTITGNSIEGFGRDSIQLQGGIDSIIDYNVIVAHDAANVRGRAAIHHMRTVSGSTVGANVIGTTFRQSMNYVIAAKAADGGAGVWCESSPTNSVFNMDIAEACGVGFWFSAAASNTMIELYTEANTVGIQNDDSSNTYLGFLRDEPIVTWSGTAASARGVTRVGRNTIGAARALYFAAGNTGAIWDYQLFPSIRPVTGSPEGVETAVVGSIALRTNGSAGTTIYVKESGTGNTGWVAYNSGSGSGAPAAHATSHAPGGTDVLSALTSAVFAAGSIDGTAGTASLRTLGTGAQQAAAGNDTRITGAAQKASNLSDLASASTARTNLGLGAAATLNTGTTAGTVAAGDDSRFAAAAQKSANLSDLASAVTARSNLGLGTAAVLNTGTTAGTVLTPDTVNAKGDLVAGTADNTVTRVAVGANGTMLIADSAQTSGVKWAAAVDRQVFTTSGTWTNPSPSVARPVLVRGMTAGSGGGSGRRGASGTLRVGGAGGAAGVPFEQWLLSTDLSATETVTVGAGGAGGAAVTSDSTDGNPGAAGGGTQFGSVNYRAFQTNSGTGGGRGGTASGAAAAGTSNAGGPPGGASSATGGTGTSGTSILHSNGLALNGAAGGGAGGGISTGNVAGAGGAGGSYPGFGTGGAGGAATGAAGGVGTSTAASGFGGGGTGGGGGGGNASGAGGAGGVGGTYGAGGGGGGASPNGSASGAGGAGADGYCLVLTFL